MEARPRADKPGIWVQDYGIWVDYSLCTAERSANPGLDALSNLPGLVRELPEEAKDLR